MGQDDIKLKHCPLANVSICTETGKDEFNVFLYNPLARSVSHYIQVPVSGDDWKVTDPEGEEVEVAVTKPIRTFDYVTKDIGGNLHENVLIFKATLPALGYSIYNVKKTNLKNNTKALNEEMTLGEDKIVGFEVRNCFLILKS